MPGGGRACLVVPILADTPLLFPIIYQQVFVAQSTAEGLLFLSLSWTLPIVTIKKRSDTFQTDSIYANVFITLFCFAFTLDYLSKFQKIKSRTSLETFMGNNFFFLSFLI